MANRLSDEIINKIPVLYSELQNKAAVARELGISVASVNKYLTVISGAPQEIKKEKKKRIKITDEVVKQINDEYKNETNPLVWDVSDRDLAIFSTLAYESESPNNLIGSLFEEDRFQGLAKMEEVKSWELGDYIAYETEDEKNDSIGALLCYGSIGNGRLW